MNSHDVILFAGFDNSIFKDPESNLVYTDSAVPYINTVPSTITYEVSAVGYEDTDDFRFTSNGIMGLTNTLSTFNIPNINFAGQNIYFVSAITSLSGAFRKSLPKIDVDLSLLKTHEDDLVITWSTRDHIIIGASNVTLSLLRGDGSTVPDTSAFFTSNFGDLTSNDAGGYYKGYMVSYETGENMRIQLSYDSGEVIVDGFTGYINLTGYSDAFDIYPSQGAYDIRKVNEDNDQTQNFKNLQFQDALFDKPVFFDNFLGQIVGNASSSTDTLGIKLHEKTSNFVSNNVDVDYANINSLTSLLDEVNIEYEEYNQEFPPTLQRIVDIVSIGFRHQGEHVNQYQLNFNDKGYTDKTVFGKNKGDMLPVDSTLLHTGDQSTNIIAFEKFSEKYTLVNTNVLSATNVDYVSPGVYPLSSYNDTWGWGLVLPYEVVEDVSLYYDFYEFVDSVEGSLLQKIIDFDNPANTYLVDSPTYKEFAEKWGIAENVIAYNLYSSLDLISSS